MSVGVPYLPTFAEYCSPFVPTIDQPTAADNQNEPYVPYYRYLLNKTNAELPQVISNSYGEAEDVGSQIFLESPVKVWN